MTNNTATVAAHTIPLVVLKAAYALTTEGKATIKVPAISPDLVTHVSANDYDPSESSNSVPRDPDEFAFAAAFDMDVSESDSEDAGSNLLTVFEHNGEYAIANISYPSYCDDECDGYICLLTYCGTDPKPYLDKEVAEIKDRAMRRVQNAQDRVDFILGEIAKERFK